MLFKLDNDKYKYDLENLCRVFFPFEKISSNEDESGVKVACESENEFKVSVEVGEHSLCKNCAKSSDDDENARLFSVLLYNTLSQIMGYFPKWGILTGVRPAKLMHRLISSMGKDEALNYFEEKLLVSHEKAVLAQRVTAQEDKIISLSTPDSFSLYISIPFCPTRCSYCSFVSHSMKSAKPLIAPYVDLLCSEIEYTAKIAKELKLKLKSIYFGGGTPTTLSAEQLDKIISTIKLKFDLSDLLEFTVEAGRPDTITREKLVVLKNHGVDRISINPQSFNDDVLTAIGRNHTADDVVDAYHLAREVGFENINMDFIAGLPGDTAESFKNSIDKAVQLGADSITVHSLAMKRASYMVSENLAQERADIQLANEMVDYSNSTLSQSDYLPYYMYRQSKTCGNLENVGWAKDGSQCLYNVFMMDETHTVLSCGAGAVTKLRAPHGTEIERIYNYKYPFEYNNSFDEMINRKEGIKTFYLEYPLESEQYVEQ